MNKIIIVRHGESEANSKGQDQGREDEWSNTDLSENGREQARKVAERLKDEKFDCIYCSDLKRAMQTAEEINKFHNIEIKFDERLRDIIEKEDVGEFVNRIKKVFLDIEREKGNVLIVAHASSCLTLLALSTGSKEEGDKFIEENRGKHGNTSVSLVEKIGDKYDIRFAGCVKHLDNR